MRITDFVGVPPNRASKGRSELGDGVGTAWLPAESVAQEGLTKRNLLASEKASATSAYHYPDQCTDAWLKKSGRWRLLAARRPVPTK
jgi:hypothetical protein